MKKILLSIFFLNFIYLLMPQSGEDTARIYIFKVIAFNAKYEIYCTKQPNGYYKYEDLINNTKVYLTYEGKEFYDQCKFDENLTVFSELYASNMWSNNKGEIINFKKRYSPVTDKNRKRKNYPYGFGKN